VFNVPGRHSSHCLSLQKRSAANSTFNAARNSLTFASHSARMAIAFAIVVDRMAVGHLAKEGRNVGREIRLGDLGAELFRLRLVEKFGDLRRIPFGNVRGRPELAAVGLIIRRIHQVADRVERESGQRQLEIERLQLGALRDGRAIVAPDSSLA